MLNHYAPVQNNNTASFARRNGCMVSPPTTDFALVFPLNQKKFKFDKSFYSPALTDGRLSTEQLKTFLKDVERQVKKKLRPIKCAIISYICLVFLGLFSLFSFGTEDYNDYNSYNSYNNADPTINTVNSTYTASSDSSDYIDYNSPAYGSGFDDDFDSFVCAFFMYFLFILIGGVILQLYIRNRQNRARRDVQTIIDNSKGIFAMQGLRWNISMGFPHWIELWKDYKGQNMNMIAPPQQYNNYVMPAPPQIFQQPMTMPNMTTPSGYPIFAVPTYHSNLNFTQQPMREMREMREHRNVQGQERDQYIPPNLGENNA